MWSALATMQMLEASRKSTMVLGKSPDPRSPSGWQDGYEYLWICGACHHLVDRDRPDGREQQCRCRPNPDALPIQGDYSERAILCRCCATVAIESGSRWRVHFCRECRLLAMGVSLWEGRLIFPIGIHSLVNGFLPDTRPPTLAECNGDEEALARDLEEAIDTMVGRLEFLEAWSERIVAENLKRLGISGDVRLKDYLEAVEREQLNVLRVRGRAFSDMCEAYRTWRDRSSQNEGPERPRANDG